MSAAADRAPGLCALPGCDRAAEWCLPLDLVALAICRDHARRLIVVADAGVKVRLPDGSTLTAVAEHERPRPLIGGGHLRPAGSG